jgi:soluble lytic murein transglycosylase-like protein
MKLVLSLLAGVALVGAAFFVEPTSANTATWNDVETWIAEDAVSYGVSASWLLSVAWCESRGNPYAVGRAGEVGPFQFHPHGVWWDTPAGLRGISPWDIRANVQMAAWAFSRGLSSHWSCA